MNWISVKDRLPDDHNYVLVSSNYDSKGISRTTIGISCYSTNAWMGNVELDLCWFDGSTRSILEPELITHWMPLPKGPDEVD